MVAVATLASRFLGFLRDMTVAFALGAGPLSDAFFVAFRLPNLLRRLTGEGAMTLAFIPVFARVRQERGLDAAMRFSRAAFVWQAVILIVLCALAMVFAGPLTALTAPGFEKDPEIFARCVQLVRITFPYVIFISAVALCQGVLNSVGHFLSPALSPCLLNVVLMAAALLGWALGRPTEALAWGVLLAGVVQLAFQWPYMRRNGFTVLGPWRLWDRDVFRVFTLMGPSVFGAAVYQTNTVLITILASLLPFGSVSYLYYADRLVEFPLGVFGFAVSTAAMPSLAGLMAKGDRHGFLDTVSTTVGLTMFISIPAAVGLLALAEPVIHTLFGRGRFGPQDVLATSQALMAFAVGMPATSVARPLVSAFYAMEDTRTPVLAATVCLVFNAALGWVLMQFMAHAGLALAVAAASTLNAGLLLWAFGRRLGERPKVLVPALCNAALSVPLYLGAAWSCRLGGWSLALIPIWVGLYMLLAMLVGRPEARLLAETVWSRLARSGRQEQGGR